MGKDLHNDNFEDFIKNNLEGFDEEPSDAMWNRIAPVIPPKPSIKWANYVLPTVVVLSLALITFFGVKMYEYKSTSETLTEELKQTNHKIDILTDKVADFSNKKEDELIGEKPMEISRKNIENSIEKVNIKNKIGEELKLTIESKNKIGKHIISNRQVNNGVNIPTNKLGNGLKTVSKTFVLDSENNNENQKTLVTELNNKLNNKLNNPIENAIENSIINRVIPSKTDLKPLATLDLKPNYSIVSPNIMGVKVKAGSTKNKFFRPSSITLLAAPTIVKNNIHPKKNGASLPPNNVPKPDDMIRLGKSIGVKFNTGLSERLSLTIGTVYSKLSFGFRTKHKLNYNKDNEESISTDKVSNSIDYLGLSSYGEYSVDLDVTRSTNSTINQGEEIDVELEGTIDIKLVTIPVYLTYKLVDKNKLSFGLKGGVSYNKMIENDLIINDFEINREGIEVKKFGTKTSPQPTQKMSFNVISGLALEYALTDNWGLSLEPTWSSALSDNNRGKLWRTKSSIFSLEAGVKYTF